jgi:hypothetical protein
MDLQEENQKLKEQIEILKQQLSKYTNPQRIKQYQERNKDKIKEYHKRYYEKKKLERQTAI